MTVFPAIRVTNADYQAGVWPTTSAISQSGVVTRRLWGSRSNRARLRLTCANITKEEADLLLLAYEDSQGPTKSVALPSGLPGLTPVEQEQVQRLTWHFSETPPTNGGRNCERLTTRIELVAEGSK